MSREYRSPFLEPSPEPSRSYGLVIAAIGAGIVVLALAAMLISPLIRTESVTAEFDPTEIAEVYATPFPTSTAIPASTGAPVPTAITVTATVEPVEQPTQATSEQEDDAAYVKTAIDTREALLESFDRYVALLATARLTDPDWQAEMELEFALWESTHEEIAELTTPDRHYESHESLKEGTARFSEAAIEFRTSYDGVNPDGITNAMLLIGDGLFYLNQSMVQISHERAR